ncbi:50S ribosomal protein L25 [Halanaerobiaceae bacterium Z-7014]|uniref:Large ribosomal subunit protein bL25 n=1 Tax=Halonatronomonas betaini TaxID=2778430 RepID=A0A931ASD3_9FIRM|nr:50S ribosomal protein L25 [Halonatronomonas betaini]MBF8437254.1 50S ribosomal protein L25 [Halonatronomonas betaini]
MERFQLEAEAREKTGKSIARKLRREGKIPGVVYGRERNPQPLIVDPLKLKGKLDANAIVDLTIKDDGEKSTETVMIKDYQKHVIKNELLHVDFHHISMDETITVTIPIETVGKAYGVQEGGVLQQLMREVEIECLPTDIPDKFELDITELDVGDSLQVSDLEVGDEIDLVSALDDVIVTVVTPSEEITEEVEEELLDVEGLEPEVIGEETEEVEEELEGEEEEEKSE